MTKHKRLYEISELIGYEDDTFVFEGQFWRKKMITNSGFEMIICDVREIIFTQEFIDKFIQAGLETGDYDGYEVIIETYFYLGDPVDYLYNEIK